METAKRKFAWRPVHVQGHGFIFWQHYIKWREEIEYYQGSCVEVRRYLEEDYFVELLLGKVHAAVACPASEKEV